MIDNAPQLRRNIYGSSIALIVTIFISETTQIDPWFESFLYSNGHWLWAKSEPIARLILYTSARDLVAVIAILALISFVLLSRSGWLKPSARGPRVVLLSLILIPTLVGALKQITNVACPSKVDLFGGSLPYLPIFSTYPIAPIKTQLCFPAGHASAGFALLSLAFLFSSKIHQRIAIIGALIFGWVIGFYKMAIGDHYLSHTFVSMEIAWLIISILALCECHLEIRRVTKKLHLLSSKISSNI